MSQSPINAHRQVFVVRHAQTSENEHLIKISTAIINFCKYFHFPSVDTFKAVLHLLKCDTDSKLSAVGMQQAKSLQQLVRHSAVLKKSFFQSPDLILISTMERTRQTAELLFPEAVLLPGVVVETPLLNEATIYEYAAKGTLLARIKQFEAFLGERLQHAEHVVIVGHCQYLQHMLHTKQRMRNCDIYETTFDMTAFLSTLPPTGPTTIPTPLTTHSPWLSARHILSSPLAVSHPIDRLKHELLQPACRYVSNFPARLFEKTTSGLTDTHRGSGSATNSTNDTQGNIHIIEGEGRMCRICQITEEEAPEMPLIHPCKCRGSLMYVHMSCLSTWRATSSTAFTQCGVCKFSYIRSQSRLAEIIANPTGIMWMTVGITGLAIFLAGFLGSAFLHVYKYDAIDKLCRVLEVPVYWRQCTSHSTPASNIISNALGNISYCDPSVVWGVETIIIGLVVVGVLGLLLGLFQEMGFLIAPIGWFFSMNENARVRVAVVLGSILASRYVYMQVTKSARRLALLGEIIESVDINGASVDSSGGIVYTNLE